MAEGKSRIPGLQGLPQEIADYKEAFRKVHSPDWLQNSIPMDATIDYLNKAAALQDSEAQRWKCGARQRNVGPDIQDCDWPVCGCDPYANKVLDAIAESGFEIIRKEDERPKTDAHCQICGQTDREWSSSGKMCGDKWHERSARTA